MKNQEGSDKKSLLVKYKYSVFLDELVAFIPGIAINIAVNYVERLSAIFRITIGFLAVLFSLVLFLISDKMFRNQSLGKRIYNIEVRNRLGPNQVALLSLMHRRVLEAWVFRFLVVNNRFISLYTREGFSKKIKEIDVKTGTYITQS